MSHRSLVAARSANANARRLIVPSSSAAGGVSRTALRSFASYYSHLHGVFRNDRVGCCRLKSTSSSAAESSSTTSSSSHANYKKPRNVELWEDLASKELSKSNMTVDSLRTERVTPVSIGVVVDFMCDIFCCIA